MIQLETERLLLRQWRDEDLSPWIAMNQDTEVRKYFGSLLTTEESTAALERYRDKLERSTFGLWAVEVKDSHEFIGFIGISEQDVGNEISPFKEIGWRLKKDAWGKGFATEGALEVLKYGHTIFPIIYSMTAKVNTPSIKVMERIGMKRALDLDFNHPRVHNELLKPHLIYMSEFSL
jgi:RimJ/RimL family protein N-acetyltransferase